MGVDESFTLTFSSHQNIQDQPDFSPLHADFELLSTSHTFGTSIVNGTRSQEIGWNLLLRPKREGKLSIPSVKFGGYHSEPLTIEVTKEASLPSQEEDTIWLETELQPDGSVYEQSLLIYRFRLYRSVQLAQGTLSELKSNDPDAIIEKLGKDREYTVHKNGKQYLVFERKYAVLPQHVGELVFAPVIFNGKMMIEGGSFFNMQTKMKRLSSDQKTIAVKPIPAPFQKSNWFPAQDVAIAEEWSSDVNQMTLGEPVTWTVKISAKGSLGSQIPDITLNLPVDVKQYLDKPEVSDELTAEGVLGEKQIKVALIPKKAGEIVLPELIVPWWDLKSNERRVATLPARTVQVSAATPQDVAMHPPENAVKVEDTASQHISKETSGLGMPDWVWGLIGLNVIVLAGLSIVVCSKLIKKNAKPKSMHQVRAHLKQACDADDAKMAEALLLVWAGHVYPETKYRNILEIKQQHLSEDFNAAIDELYHFLYGQRKSWNGASFWSAFFAFKCPKECSKQMNKQETELLRKLYG